MNAGHISESLRQAIRASCTQLAGDICSVLNQTSLHYEGGIAYVSSCDIPLLQLTSTNGKLSSIEIQDSIIDIIELEPSMQSKELPKFKNCIINNLIGSSGPKDIPLGVFENCEFNKFDIFTETSAATLDMDLPIGVKVLLVCIRKLYLQKGTGRKESAFYRGIDPLLKRYVDPILGILLRQGLVARAQSRDGGDLWLPVRGQRVRANRIFVSPNQSDDPALIQARQLS